MQLTLIDTRIRQDAYGRHCLNDLHRAAVAAGANKRSKEPGEFFKARRTRELLALLEQESATEIPRSTDVSTTEIPRSFDEGAYGDSPYPPTAKTDPIGTLNDGVNNGTYVCIELVIAYGQFVSAAFDLKVIRTFLAVQHQQHAMPHIQATKFWDLLRPHWADIARLALAGHKNKTIAAQVGRSAASVGNCLRRQYEVGYCNPVDVFKARLAPATAARWAIAKPVAAQWGRPVQSAAQGVLDFAEALA